MMSRKTKKDELTPTEVIPSSDTINLTFQSIINTEAHRLKKIAQASGLSADEMRSLKDLAGTYRTIGSEQREQAKEESLNRLSHEELIQLAFKVINGLGENEKKDFILNLIKSNQRLLEQ